MPQASFVHDGKVIDYTPSTDVAQGAVVVIGDLVGVAKKAIAANTPGSVDLEGVFDVNKATGASTGIAAGAIIYFDVADGVVKTNSESGANKQFGKTIRVAGDNDATVRARLSQ